MSIELPITSCSTSSFNAEALCEKELKMQATVHVDFDEALSAYSAGIMSRSELEKLTGLWFGNVLLELAKRELPLPRYAPSIRYTPEQKQMYEKLFEVT
jgi:hypothetical protein